jgi:hypothetical protein
MSTFSGHDQLVHLEGTDGAISGPGEGTSHLLGWNKDQGTIELQ